MIARSSAWSVAGTQTPVPAGTRLVTFSWDRAAAVAAVMPSTPARAARIASASAPALAPVLALLPGEPPGAV